MEETVPHLSGKEFEELLLARGRYLKKQKILCLGRYGVQGSLIGGEWIPIQSYPDLEGDIAPHGRHIIIEAKVVSGASFSLTDESAFKEHQKKHLLSRATFGALCFVFLHFNARKLTNSVIPSKTFAIPVHPDLPMWEDLRRGELKTLNWKTLENYEVPEVPWSPCGSRGVKLAPELEPFLDYQYDLD